MVFRKRGLTKADDIRATPPDFFAKLDAVHHFTIDACALPSNTKCSVFYSLEGLCRLELAGGMTVLRGGVNGLTGRFDKQRVFCNPPFSEFDLWLPWAWQNSAAESITMIAPGVRGDQPWWQKWVEPYRDDQPERRGIHPSPARIITLGDSYWRLKTDFQAGRVEFLEDGHPIWRKDKSGQVIVRERGARIGEPYESKAMFGVVVLNWAHV